MGFEISLLLIEKDSMQRANTFYDYIRRLDFQKLTV
jgi:hypothetical protein